MKRRIVTVFLCLVLIGALCVGFGVAPSGATLEEELEAAEKKLADAKKNVKELESQISQAKADQERQIETKILLENQLQAINEQMDAASDVLKSLEAELDAKNGEIDRLREKYDESYAVFRARARANYEAGRTTVLEALLTSGTFSEMMTRIDLQAQITEYDRALMSRLSDSIKREQALAGEIGEAIERQEAVKAEITALQKEQKSRIAEIESAIRRLESNQSAYEREEARLEARMEELDAQIVALIKSIEEYKGGELVWPIKPGYSCRVSSYFGKRTLYGVPEFHNAIDIAASTGTPIVAAGDGTIVHAKWVNTGGGYQIMIDHGNNLITQYNHTSGFAKNPATGKKYTAGDKVKKGDIIAYVGSTGNSTGPHLDFKIIVNNTSTRAIDKLGLKYSKSMEHPDYQVYRNSSIYLNPLDFVTKDNVGTAPYSIKAYLDALQ